MRSRPAGVKTTLMRNGRDRRLGKPVRCHARKERVLLFGTQLADHIRASGQSGCIQRPDTWLHPNASLKRQIPLAPRAPSIHGTLRHAHWPRRRPFTGEDRKSSTEGQTDAIDPTRTSAATLSCGRRCVIAADWLSHLVERKPIGSSAPERGGEYLDVQTRFRPSDHSVTAKQ